MTMPTPAPSPWTKASRVRLAPRAVFEVEGPALRIDAAGALHEFPLRFLEVLAFFREEHTLAEGWARLAQDAKGTQELADAMAMLLRLCDLGVLVGAAGPPRAVDLRPGQVYGPHEQILMLEDRRRTALYIEAIRATVRPGDVVVDVGTGSGVLAVAAAQAGARHVYALEARPIADAAQAFFTGSGFGDRITLLRGQSTGLELPEKADVLVAELIGNEPLGERILEVTADAVARLLKPGARLVPSRLRILATPWTCPSACASRPSSPRRCSRAGPGGTASPFPPSSRARRNPRTQPSGAPASASS
ncbi:MAG: 50S ribosomal protein L11 methyltransferase [Holophagaceae bacterium]|nr:50S ribosomal protein L11 methyltransferase [Holophagaceae bacterium]